MLHDSVLSCTEHATPNKLIMSAGASCVSTGRSLLTDKRSARESVSATRLAGILKGLRTRQGDGVKLDTLRFGK